MNTMSELLPAMPDPQAARAYLDEAVDGLSDASASAIARWVREQVDQVVAAYGRLAPEAAEAARKRARQEGVDAAEVAVERLRSLRGADVSRPGMAGPLELVGDLYEYPTRILVDAGVPPAERDAFEEDRFPDDIYGLRLHSFNDLPGGEELATLHLVWGAAKAAVLRAERGSLFE